MSGITGKTPRVKYPEVTDPPAPPAPPAPPGSATSDRGYGPEAKTETPDTKKTPGDHAWLREWANLKGYDETPMPARALPTGAPTRPPRPTPRFGLREKRAQLETNWKHRGLLRDWFSEQDEQASKSKASEKAAEAEAMDTKIRADAARDGISVEEARERAQDAHDNAAPRRELTDEEKVFPNPSTPGQGAFNIIYAGINDPKAAAQPKATTQPAQPKAAAQPKATTQPAQPKATTQPAQPKATTQPAKPAQPPAPGNLPASKRMGRRRSSFQDSFVSPFNPGAPGRRRANLGRG